jgi:hypothetical protein
MDTHFVIIDYINSENNEKKFFIQEYNKLLNDNYELYSLPYLLKIFSKYETCIDTIYFEVNNERDKFITIIYDNIVKKLNINYNVLSTVNLIKMFYYLNMEFNFTNQKLINILKSTLKYIFNILIKRGKRIYLEKKAGYQHNLTNIESTFLSTYYVNIQENITEKDYEKLYKFIKHKNKKILDDQLIFYKNKKTI